MSVATENLSMFFIVHTHSILTYCMPAICPLLPKTRIESLENVQKLCTETISPSSECCGEWLNVLSLPPKDFLVETSTELNFWKIMSDEHHQLHSFIPERQSVCCRRSARLKDSISVRSRTTKRQDTSFMYAFTRFLLCFYQLLLLVPSFYWQQTQVFLFFLFVTNCFIWRHMHLNSWRINKSVNP